MSNQSPKNNTSLITVAIIGALATICAATIGALANLYKGIIPPPIVNPVATATSYPLAVNTHTPIPAISPMNFIASLSEYVQDLRFFESGSDEIPKDQRFYSTKFSVETARYIYWDLTLEFPQPGETIQYVIHAVYYRSDGSIFYEHDRPGFAAPNSLASYFTGRAGWNEAGHWTRDTYTVVLSVNSIEIATGSFIVE